MTLAKLKQVDPRKLWPEEDKDFTPWLSSPEGLAVLNETLGMELELENTEAYVGSYRADIVAKDTMTDSYVVIENQLSQTNHDHIGKLLTYAASFDAKTIVWIAQNFREEHRQVVDWLNNITSKDIDFFGIEIELLQIGESPYAANLKIVSKPNEWSRTIRNVKETLTKGDTLKLDYWTAFNEYLMSHNKPINIRKAGSAHWYDVSIGKSGAHISLTLRTNMKDIGCEIYMHSDDAKALFQFLLRDKEVIERVTGPLEWQELPEKQASRIIVRNKLDPTNKETWENCFRWYLETLAKFKRELVPRIKNFYSSQS
jgi:hypothetical protein